MQKGTKVVVVTRERRIAYRGTVVGTEGNFVFVDSPDTGEIHRVPAGFVRRDRG